MPLNDTALNAMADRLGALATHLAIHTADPGATGTNPSAAARRPVTWPAAANGDITATNVAFTGGTSNGAATYVGLWSALTAGTFYGGFLLSGDTTFNANGDYTITSLTINGSAT